MLQVGMNSAETIYCKRKLCSWFKIQIPILYVSCLGIGTKVLILVRHNSLFRKNLCQSKLSAGR